MTPSHAVEACHVPSCDEAACEGGLCHSHAAAERLAYGDVMAQRDIQVATDFVSPPKPPDLSGLRSARGSDRYGTEALRGIMEEARSTRDGRNVTLSRVGFRVGQLIAQGHVHYQEGADFCQSMGMAMKLPPSEVSYVLFRRSGALTKGMASV